MTLEGDPDKAADSPAGMLSDGTYVMMPTGVVTDGQTRFRPTHDGPFRPEELGTWARFYCLRNTGVFPTAVDFTVNLGVQHHHGHRLHGGVRAGCGAGQGSPREVRETGQQVRSPDAKVSRILCAPPASAGGAFSVHPHTPVQPKEPTPATRLGSATGKGPPWAVPV